MNLKKYDEKCIKIIDIFGYEYEGNAIYNNQEYTYHEFGRDEDSLQILNYLFFKETIKKIIVLENGFTNDYGYLEKEIVKYGIDEIENAIDYEDNDHICRIIRCIKDMRKSKKKEDLIVKVKDLLKNNSDEMVNKELKSL